MAAQMPPAGAPGAPPPKKKGTITLFKDKKPQMPDVSGIREDVNNVSRRLRILEESFTNIRKQLGSIEDNMLSKNKVFSTEIRTTMSDISEIKKEMHEVKTRMVELVKELNDAANKEDVKVLEKYINIWNPVKFVTQKEVQDIINEVLEKRDRQRVD